MIKLKREDPEGLQPEPALDKKILNSDPLIRKIFGNLPIGILFIHLHSETCLYANRFFVSNHFNEKEIVRIIMKHYKKPLEENISTGAGKEISVRVGGRRKTLGFSYYPVDDETLIVLLSEIGSKSVLSDTRNENVFYDKLSELIAEVAHEIGNPLSGINMSLQVLLHNILQWPSQKSMDYISRTVMEIERLSDFLKNIREVSRETDLKMRWINLHQTVEKLFVQNADLTREKKIVTENRIPGDMEVFLDGNAFYQIILNLLNNSLQILKPHEKAEFYIEDIDRFYIRLVFRNNGVAIDPQILERIFSPFFTTKEKGQGMGLAISLKLMTRMGGTIKAETPPNGIGARFVIYIPNRERINEE